MPGSQKRTSFHWDAIRELLNENKFEEPKNLEKMNNVECTKRLLSLFGFEVDKESKKREKKKIKTEKKCALIVKNEKEPFVASQCIELDVKSAYPSVGATLPDEIANVDMGVNTVRRVCRNFVELRKSALLSKNPELEKKHKLNSCMFIGCLESILPQVREIITSTIYDYMKTLTDYIEGFKHEKGAGTTYRILRIWTDSVIFTVSKESREMGMLGVDSKDIEHFIGYGKSINNNIVIKVDKDAYCMWLNGSWEASFLRNGKIYQRGLSREIAQHKNAAVTLLLENLILQMLKNMYEKDKCALNTKWGGSVQKSLLFTADIEETVGLLTNEVELFSVETSKRVYNAVAKVFKTQRCCEKREEDVSRCIMCNLPLSRDVHKECIKFCNFKLSDLP